VDEMVQIYMSKGLSFDDAHTIVGIISKDRKMFVDFMMVEELGLLVDLDDAHGPKKQGAVMFASFLLFGAIPLLAYLPGKGQGTDAVFVISCVLTMISLIVLGSVKGFLAGLSITRSAAFMVLNGTISGLVSFLSGHLIEAALQKEVHASPPPI
jgi:vacuolar iron transporter family protein